MDYGVENLPPTWIVLMPRPRQYLVKTSAESTDPMMLPRCGTLFTYGSALVTKMFRFPGSGRIGRGFGDSSAIVAKTGFLK